MGEPTDPCPKCDYAPDRATPFVGDARPAAGDCTVCMSCGVVLRFDASLQLHVFDQEWRALFAKQPGTIRTIERAQRAIWARGPLLAKVLA